MRVRVPGGRAKKGPEEEIHNSRDVTVEMVKDMAEIEIEEGSYWGGDIDAVVKVTEGKMSGGEVYLEGKILGTQSEPLLRAASGLVGQRVRVHLCGGACPGTPHAEDLIHMTKFRKAPKPLEEWMTNLQSGHPGDQEEDELQALRREKETRKADQEAKGRGQADPAAPEEVSSSEERGQEEGKKEEEEEKDEGRLRQRSQDLVQEHGTGCGPGCTGQVSTEIIQGGPEQEQGGEVDRVIFEHQRREHRRPGRSGDLWRLRKSEDDRAEDAWSFVRGSSRRGRREPADGGRRPLQRSRRATATFDAEVLPTDAGSKDVTRDESGKPNPGSDHRLGTERPAGPVLGCGGSEAEEPRDDGTWNRNCYRRSSLSSVPEFREAALRAREESKAKNEAQRPYGTKSQPAKSQRRGLGDERWKERKWKREAGKERLGQERLEEGREREAGGRQAERGVRIPREEKIGQTGQRIEEKEMRGFVMAPQVPEHQVKAGQRPFLEWLGQSRVENLVGSKAEEGSLQSKGEPRNSGPSKEDHSMFHLDDAADQQLCFSGCRFADLGEPLMKSLQLLMWERHCKILTMAMDTAFPLPLGDYEGVPPNLQSWLQAILLGLNSLAGCNPRTGKEVPTKLQQKMVQGMLPFLERLCKTSETVPQGGFKDLFNVKGVDYRGEEIKLAMSFKWPSIAGALPREVATLELSEFCCDGCRFFVNDFKRFLVPESQQQLGRTPRVMVADEDWFGVCKGLLDTGICGILPREQLHHIGGSPLLNGMFAVSKNEFQGTMELQRLIMNLVPLNRK